MHLDHVWWVAAEQLPVFRLAHSLVLLSPKNCQNSIEDILFHHEINVGSRKLYNNCSSWSFEMPLFSHINHNEGLIRG